MAIFDRHTSCYSISFTVTLDDNFTPAVISGIENLRVGRFEIDAQGSAIPGTVVSDLLPLDSSVEEGPVNLTFPFDDLPQLSNGHGYQLSVSRFMLSVHYEFMLHGIVQDCLYYSIIVFFTSVEDDNCFYIIIYRLWLHI